MSVSRAQFLKGGAGGVALVAGGAVLGLARPGSAQAQTRGDLAILELGATAELLAVEFYTRALRARPRGIEREYLVEARRNERAHYTAWAELLGDDAPEEVDATFPEGTFASAQSIARLGVVLETAFVQTYLGAVRRFSRAQFRVAAAAVAANEAQHLSVLSEVANDDPISLGAFPEPISPADAAAALGPLLGGAGGEQITG